MSEKTTSSNMRSSRSFKNLWCQKDFDALTDIAFPACWLSICNLSVVQLVNQVLLFSLICLHPSGCPFSPLADLPDPQDAGEQSFLVSDDHRLLQIATLVEVIGQDSQGAKVRRL